jgi:hypothetical protein
VALIVAARGAPIPYVRQWRPHRRFPSSSSSVPIR